MSQIDPDREPEDIGSETVPANDSDPVGKDAISGTGVDAVPGEPSRKLSRRALRRRRRTILIATFVAVLASACLYWSGVFDKAPVEVPELAIRPEIMMEQTIAEARAKQSPTFQVFDFEINDEMMEGLRGLDFIETLIIDKGVVTDASMDVIASLPKLQHLRLRLSPITDAGIEKLAQSQSLWYLNLPQSELTANGVAALGALPKLRMLRLGSTKLSNDVTYEIAKLQPLRSVHLIGVPVTNNGLKALAEMPHIESLYLDDSAVTDAGWLWLFDQHPEIHVHVNQKHHDRDPQAHVHHD